ncbi:formate--tetrahydrofolate ligase [Geomicrobium sp. JSM 1781026]|uniref:formate--tetrahydrofolate ligase n=1 Tax=Geomicrobium sp. JSM 1781026 TaxID=3344580 RepID=UPI0035C1C67A
MGNSDIEIAYNAKMENILNIAAKLQLQEEDIELYGKHKAKINDRLVHKGKAGKLILVSALTPTPAGEGKTTTTVGLGDALNRLGKKTVITLREPSFGPVFGMKGGAAGGGHSQVVPMEDINLHFTGDLHAIGAANNLLAAMIDNHIYQGNELDIQPQSISWKRCVDMNDRQLRHVVSGLQGRTNGIPREDGFEITVASEIMAILCLASDRNDLKTRLERIVIGFSYDRKPVTAGDLRAAGAMAAILKDAFKPNLVQTLENNPAIIHGGPFANIAHGCNSVIATKTAMQLGDYAVTEAGFGADLGAEKFVNIKCRTSGITPAAAVVVATVRALKMHGGVEKVDLDREDVSALERGMPNLLRHLDNMTHVYGIPTVVSINRFPTDTDEELEKVSSLCKHHGYAVEISNGWAEGGKGVEPLAQAVINLVETETSKLTYTYKNEDRMTEKVQAIVESVYRGKDVKWSAQVLKKIEQFESAGFGELPVCIAKTQYSFSDDRTLTGAPEQFAVSVRDVKLSAGAGFIVVVTGAVMTMPGLPKQPAAEQIDLSDDGVISGLF